MPEGIPTSNYGACSWESGEEIVLVTVSSAGLSGSVGMRGWTVGPGPGKGLGSQLATQVSWDLVG